MIVQPSELLKRHLELAAKVKALNEKHPVLHQHVDHRLDEGDGSEIISST